MKEVVEDYLKVKFAVGHHMKLQLSCLVDGAEVSQSDLVMANNLELALKISLDYNQYFVAEVNVTPPDFVFVIVDKSVDYDWVLATEGWFAELVIVARNVAET